MGEDQFFLMRILVFEPVIEFTNVVFYRYRVGRNDSLTGSKGKIIDLVSVIKSELALKIFPKKYVAIKHFLILKQITTLFKHGSLFHKIQAINFLLIFLFSNSVTGFKTCINFINHQLRKT